MRVGLIALRDFTFDGTIRRQGDFFEEPPLVAAALTYQRKARFATPTDHQPELKQRRTYRRRDLTAEPPIATESDV